MPVIESLYGHVRVEPENNADLKAYVEQQGVGSVSSWGNRILREFLDKHCLVVGAGHKKLQQSKGNQAYGPQGHTKRRKT